VRVSASLASGHLTASCPSPEPRDTAGYEDRRTESQESYLIGWVLNLKRLAKAMTPQVQPT